MSPRALIAVSDKRGVEGFARDLVGLGWEIVSSGGTASALRAAGVPVTAVDDVTGVPEMLGGRVKTLHPTIHAGILADLRRPEHVAELAERGISAFELVVVNLYPFREAVAARLSEEEVIEQIDIGGPAMVRAAAKNHASVGVIVDPERYEEVVTMLRGEGRLSPAYRRARAAEAFAHVASYDAAIATWFAGGYENALPGFLGLALRKAEDLRYGENPHQRGARYVAEGGPAFLGGAEVLAEGKGLSYTNWLDAAAALGVARDIPGSVTIVKHAVPCGVALRPTLGEGYAAALASDPVSAFGGVVAFGGEVDVAAVAEMAEVFTEVVVAPWYTDGALEALAPRAGLRVIRAPLDPARGPELRMVEGGALVQDRDRTGSPPFTVASRRTPTAQEEADLRFAWGVVRHVRSNAIVLASGAATVGVGAGQTSRVDAALLACRHAGERASGAVLASDAFFPFPDAVEVAADAGVTAIVHPGGSVRDEEVLALADSRGMAVVTTGERHFLH